MGVHDKYMQLRMMVRNNGIVEHNDKYDKLMRELQPEIETLERRHSTLRVESQRLIDMITKLFHTNVEDRVKLGMELEAARKRVEDAIYDR